MNIGKMLAGGKRVSLDAVVEKYAEGVGKDFRLWYGLSSP
jgi:hypothetical protein